VYSSLYVSADTGPNLRKRGKPEEDQSVDGEGALKEARGMTTVSRAALLPILALFAVQLIFGFNYAAAKVVLEHYPPTVWGALRLLLCALVMFGASGFLVPREKRVVHRSFLLRTALYGTIGMALTQFFFLMGLRHTTTVNAAIMNTMTPLFTLLVGVLTGIEKGTPRRWLGFLLAITGAVVIRDLSEFHFGSDTLVGDLFTILNCISLAAYFTLSAGFLREHSPFWATAWMFLFGAIVLFLFSGSELPLLFQSGLDQRFYLAAAYNVVFATLITYFLNAWTLTKVSPSVVAIFFYFQPVIAVFNGWLNLGESPNARTFAAMGLIFGGLGLGVVRKK
jgi:drug/metabolite transporter (DMT)-like permease